MYLLSKFLLKHTRIQTYVCTLIIEPGGWKNLKGIVTFKKLYQFILIRACEKVNFDFL